MSMRTTCSRLGQAIALGLTASLALALASLVIYRGASYLGLNGGSLATGLASLYPLAAVGEGAKLLLGSMLFFTLAAGLGQLLFPHWTTRRGLSLTALLLLWLIPPYTLCLWASAVEYPALYEAFLGPAASQLLYRSGGVCAPWALRSLALVAALIPWGVSLVRAAWRADRRALARGKNLGTVFALLAASFVLWIVCPRSLSHAPQQRESERVGAPDVLLIAVDSLRVDRAFDPGVAPKLAKFQAEPHTSSFTDHHVGIPRTFPSWVEMLRGEYAARHHIRHMFPSLPARRQRLATFVRSLRQAGYASGVFSDFAGDIFPRFDAGFDTIDAPDLKVPTLIRMGVIQSMPLFLPLVLSPLGRGFFPDLRENPAYADPALLAERARRWLASQKQPTLTTVFFSTAHFPYAAPWPWYRSFTDPAYPGPFYFQKNPSLLEKTAELSAADIAHVRSLYDGAVHAVDAAIGELLAYLEASGRDRHTLVIVTADHGEDLFEHGRLQGHGEHLVGRNVVEVPLLIRLPRAGQPTARPQLDFTTRSVDLAPTILALCGVRAAQPFDGVDLSPWLQSADLKPPELTAYTETGIWFARSGEGFFQRERLDYPGINELLHFDPGATGDIVLNPQFETSIVGAKHRSLVRGRYKLIYEPRSEGVLYRLYDRLADPHNTNDLFSGEPGIAKAMKDELWHLIAELEGAMHVRGEFVVAPP